jgi:hypothetical protein
MKTLFSTVLIAVLALGFLLAVSPTRADAWFRHGPFVGVSVVVPPFGVSIGAPAPYYYPGYAYVAPPYPVYEPVYYSPYYGPYYRPFFRHHHFGHRPVWRGERHERMHERWNGR